MSESVETPVVEPKVEVVVKERKPAPKKNVEEKKLCPKCGRPLRKPPVERALGGGRACIKPGCRKVSKGPRFHFLCETHMDTPKKEWKKWVEK
jgi:NAD-dependent DNA ligase